MKSLFIIVSVLALSYLALQTTIVKGVFANITNTFEKRIEGNQVSNGDAKNHDDLIAKLSKLTIHSEQQNLVFTKRISELEGTVEALKYDLQSNIDTQVSPPQSTPITQTQEFEPNLIDKDAGSIPKNISSTDKFHQEASAIMPLVQTNQQQKRIQQQAVLRALSQKMELAALGSLVNSRSGN